MEIKLDIKGKEKLFVTGMIKARLVRKSIELTQNINYENLSPEELDKLVDFVCEVYNDKFTRDEFWDGINADKLLPTFSETIKGLTDGVTSRLNTFPENE